MPESGYRIAQFHRLFLDKKIGIEAIPILIVSERLDLNQRPLEPHSSALPDCATLRNRGCKFKLVVP